jgi:hypothetical protein
MAVGDRIRLHADIAMGPTHSSLERHINRDTLLFLGRQINRDGGVASTHNKRTSGTHHVLPTR